MLLPNFAKSRFSRSQFNFFSLGYAKDFLPLLMMRAALIGMLLISSLDLSDYWNCDSENSYIRIVDSKFVVHVPLDSGVLASIAMDALAATVKIILVRIT